ncbi:MAG: hypothetical protein HON14_18865 [Rhodospirillaceae bacterium]|jgi:uncharacterized protein YndB with AHSA1/START domain|nr:hypothetical protein [Rhodospirillaceae bacterium]MBT4588519.1 hypothetical protein [Rhodospirillaceae bacterium]MBT4941211.1 hypothetical protein [Rhodospirillaceae bacterium]MBT5938537.1 hypothetical protein [Rhodospirillaceae bacterium]MBT7268789.1 hypothetical protein [Rhodospirillaceae bacterium]
MNKVNQIQRVAPIEKKVRVKSTSEAAFKAFTEEIASWWPLDRHSLDSENVDSLVFEAELGGAIYQTMKDGTTIPWAKVQKFTPPDGFVLDWHIGVEPENASRVEVTFSDAGDGMTEVTLLHSDFENSSPEDPEAYKGHYANGWVTVFEDCFAGHFK